MAENQKKKKKHSWKEHWKGNLTEKPLDVEITKTETLDEWLKAGNKIPRYNSKGKIKDACDG